ncbi:chloride channel protein [Methylobacterium sp. E-046]|uniref:chloride channel protein n=1 Tax=Methylobacterium sp. E-046 TaxID=2836576 RepID=UPI001FBA11BB|nr:chloride channel protein [Methylobacterium sp. E-046]MCJ2103499.1 chloride channel protein [Methylobacterium sp. E-046]
MRAKIVDGGVWDAAPVESPSGATPPASPQPNVVAGGLLGRRFWLLVPATGLAAGLGAGLLMQLLTLVQWLAFGARSDAFLEAVQATGWGHRVLVLSFCGLLVTVGIPILRHVGRHGGDLSAALWFGSGALDFPRNLAQGAISIVVVGLGCSLGREQAPKQVGAAFASLFATRAGLAGSRRRVLAAFGAGAGIAAVYDVPLGGALFALEVLLGTLALPLVAPAIATTAIATGTAWLLLPDRQVYVVPTYATSPSLVAFAVAASVPAGAISALYVRVVTFADTRRPKGGVGAVVAPLVVFVGLGLLAIPLPQLLGNGKDAVQLAFTGTLAWPILAAMALVKPLATAACLGCGAPGGLFTPTITFGAMLGGLAGAGWAFLWPGAPCGACAVIVAAAVLAATTQGPVSAVVLMVELTRSLDAMMVPVLIAVGGAMLAARVLEPRSIYAYRIAVGRITAVAGPGRTISVAAPYLDLLRGLPADGEALLVLDESGRVVGEASPARARNPGAGDEPLATATAGDFAVRLPNSA